MKNEKTEPTMSELLEYVGTRKNFFNANAERLNREHLDALNATIIKLSNSNALLLSAAVAVRGDVEAWSMHLNDTGKLKASQDAMTRWDNLRAAIANATK